MKHQRQYDKEFRVNAVKHYENGKKSLLQVARDLELPSSTLSGWVKEYKENGEESFGKN